MVLILRRAPFDISQWLMGLPCLNKQCTLHVRNRRQYSAVIPSPFPSILKMNTINEPHNRLISGHKTEWWKVCQVNLFSETRVYRDFLTGSQHIVDDFWPAPRAVFQTFNDDKLKIFYPFSFCSLSTEWFEKEKSSEVNFAHYSRGKGKSLKLCWRSLRHCIN